MATADTVYFLKSGATTASLKSSITDFGMYCNDVPFCVGREVKELSSTSYFDEDGDDEYVPSVLPVKSYEMTVKFAYKGKMGAANTAIKKFLAYLLGRDGTGAEFSMYSTYSRIGRKNVRVSSIDEDVELVRDSINGDILIIGITFKVNDPVTEWTPIPPRPTQVVDLSNNS